MIEILLIIVLLAMLSWSAWLDTVWIAAVSVVLYVAGNWLFGSLNHLSFLADPINLISLSALLLAIGAAWSLWKWRRWVRSERVQEEIRARRLKWRDSKSSDSFMESIWFPKEAKASENIERIATWIMLWPFSMVVYFFEDFLMDIGRWVYTRLGLVYVRITEAAIPKDEPE